LKMLTMGVSVKCKNRSKAGIVVSTLSKNLQEFLGWHVMIS
jgi:hypothetical protein